MIIKRQGNLSHINWINIALLGVLKQKEILPNIRTVFNVSQYCFDSTNVTFLHFHIVKLIIMSDIKYVYLF